MKNRPQNQKKEIFPNRMLFPAIIALGFIPLIVHMYPYNVGWQNIPWFPVGENERIDFFYMWKSIAVMTTASIMAVLLVWQYCKVLSLRFERAFFLLLAYAVFLTISSVLSPYKPQVFTGSYEVLQPFGTILGYVMLCYYTYCLVDQEQKLNAVLRYSGIGVCLVLTIGLFQFAGYDLFQTLPGRYAISNPDFWDKLDQLVFTFPRGTVYATLYNPDFLSFYFGLLLPVMIAMSLCAKKLVWKIIPAVTGILSVLCIIGAGAASGYLAIMISLAAGAYILLSRDKKRFRIALTATAAALVLSTIVCALTPIGGKVKMLFLGSQYFEDTFALKSLETKQDGIYMNINGHPLTVRYTYDIESEQFVANFRDGDGNELETEVFTQEDGSSAFRPKDPAYCDIYAAPAYANEVLCIGLHVDGHDWYFTNQFKGAYYYYNPFGQFDQITPVKKFRLLKDDALSGRGLIWDQTLPLLPKHMLIGSGANSFSRAYPQNDYLYKVYMSQTNLYTVKAHSWFLQEWIEAGFFGMLCLFGFYFVYLFRSIRLYRRCDLHDSTAILGFGILIGTIAYVAAGLANDANVCTAPVFWVMMGLGMSTNRMVADKIKD